MVGADFYITVKNCNLHYPMPKISFFFHWADYKTTIQEFLNTYNASSLNTKNPLED